MVYNIVTFGSTWVMDWRLNFRECNMLLMQSIFMYTVGLDPVTSDLASAGHEK